jgi:hypothetical protein
VDCLVSIHYHYKVTIEGDSGLFSIHYKVTIEGDSGLFSIHVK